MKSGSENRKPIRDGYISVGYENIFREDGVVELDRKVVLVREKCYQY